MTTEQTNTQELETTEVESVVETKKTRGRKPKEKTESVVETTEVKETLVDEAPVEAVQSNEEVKAEVATETVSPKVEDVDNEEVKSSNIGSVGGEGVQLGIFKLNEFTQDPTYATTHSACFDIRVNLKGLVAQGIERVKAITRTNQPLERRIEKDREGNLYVDLRPQERLLAPTGAIFDIPVGFSLKVHPRSGTSLKQGINLINQEGIIDADYVQELFLPLVNSSDNHVKIVDGERYAQGELQEVVQAKFNTLSEAPKQKSERDGGFGHTGVK